MRESNRRIASESHRHDANRYCSLAVISPPPPPKTQNRVLIDPAFVALRFESRNCVRWCSIHSTWNCGIACESCPRWLNTNDWRFFPSTVCTSKSEVARHVSRSQRNAILMNLVVRQALGLLWPNIRPKEPITLMCLNLSAPSVVFFSAIAISDAG